MEKLQSVEEYKRLVRQAKEECKNAFSNSYYMTADIQRYIELNQAYYIKLCQGFMLILDEGRYYRACLYIDTTMEFEIPLLDKKIVLKNVYRKGKEDEYLEVFESRLEKMGFKKEGTVVQIKCDVPTLAERCRHLEKYAQKMQSKGFRCVEADETYFEKMDKLLYASGFVRDYQIDYRTLEEKRELKKGSHLCMLNNNNELCAVNVCYVEGKTAYGEGVAVAEEYKMHGFAPIMSYYRSGWLLENGVENIQAWVLEDNDVSMRYHTSIGFRVVNKYVNEWVRQ